MRHFHSFLEKYILCYAASQHCYSNNISRGRTLKIMVERGKRETCGSGERVGNECAKAVQTFKIWGESPKQTEQQLWFRTLGWFIHLKLNKFGRQICFNLNLGDFSGKEFALHPKWLIKINIFQQIICFLDIRTQFPGTNKLWFYAIGEFVVEILNIIVINRQ